VKTVLFIAHDLLREALSRRWFLALLIAITVLLAVLGLALRLDVVDGALAATRLFGKPLRTDIRSVDVALRPVFKASAFVGFYGGLSFFILACADFGPSLLSPGRIEHLLALPVRRWQLLVGTYVGVLALASIFALYGAGGLALILAIKTGIWNLRPILGALLGVVTFAALYGTMLAVAVAARSAALSAASGAALLILGIIAGYRDALGELFENGVARAVFEAVTLLLPRISTLASSAALIAANEPVVGADLLRLLLGVALFGAGALAIGIHRFEQKDY
jgi:Cu-processing system permease protein